MPPGVSLFQLYNSQKEFMANATTVTTTRATVRPIHASPARIIRIEMPRKGPQGIQAPTPLVPSGISICAKRHRASNLSPIDFGKVHAAANAKRAQWATLNLRQEWADTAFMRGHLSVAGLRVKSSTEPATVNRMKTKLRSVGVHSPEIQDAVGMPLAKFLKVNPGLPLWAALALVLESIGRFTPEMVATTGVTA
jgi:hypothetical protein